MAKVKKLKCLGMPKNALPGKFVHGSYEYVITAGHADGTVILRRSDGEFIDTTYKKLKAWIKKK